MKTIDGLFFALLCWVGVQAVESDYQPLVREGVRWVYAEAVSFGLYYNDGAIVHHDHTEFRTYAIEFCGDTVIDNKQYKKAFRTSDVDMNKWADHTGYTSTTVPVAFFREETEQNVGHYVYAIGNVDVPQLMFPNVYAYLWLYSDGEEYNLEKYLYNKEYLACYIHSGENMDSIGEVLISGVLCTVYNWTNSYAETCIVEGVGAVEATGDLITPYFETPPIEEDATMSLTSRLSHGYLEDVDSCSIKLHHLEDTDGNIIYKGAAFNDGFAPADFDCSGTVDIDDLNQCINRVLASKSVDVTCDVTGDGRVDIDDVNAVINTMLAR